MVLCLLNMGLSRVRVSYIRDDDDDVDDDDDGDDDDDDDE